MTARQHTLWAKALKSIDLINRNYTLENNLVDTQDKMGTIVAQNLLLQDQLAALSQTTFGETDPMDEESAGPMNICSGGDAWPAASNSSGGRAISFVDDTKFLFPPLTGFNVGGSFTN